MRITIINKNKINNVSESFICDTPQILKDNYNETLDSCEIRVSHLPKKIEIEPYDVVKIEDFLETRYMCINNYTCTQDSLDNPTYSYDISMFSQTKLLEGIILPNLSITPHKEDKLSIYKYLKRYLDLYGQKVRTQSGGTVNFLQKWHFVDRVENKFNNDCPELQWNTPTLREVFTDLMMVNDCIPILKGSEIDYIDLTEVKESVNLKQGVNYIRESQSADDYISEIKMEMQNVMQTSVDGVNDVTTTSEFIPFTTEDYIANDDNIILKTQNPILKIRHLWLYSFFRGQSISLVPTEEADFGKVFVIREDLCNIAKEYKNPQTQHAEDTPTSLVYEKDEYNTKSVLYRLDFTSIDKRADITDTNKTVNGYYSKYQNYCLYYTRGENEIKGFSRLSKATAWNATRMTIDFLHDLVCYVYAKRNYLNTVDDDIFPLKNINTDAEQFSFLFKIEYETTQNTIFTASKSKKQNARVIMDNQTNSYVDAYTQGNLEYQKANRLGNKALLINQRVLNNEQVIKIGDYFPDGNDKYIVYETQYQIYPDHTEVNAYATKDYILKNYFTGVKSRVRTWNNAQKEAFVRHDLHKLYGEFSFSQHKENTRATYNYANYFLSTLDSNFNAINPIKYVATNFTLPDNSHYPTSGNYLSDCVSRLIGNSITFTFSLQDNAYLGKNVDFESVDDHDIKLNKVIPMTINDDGVNYNYTVAGLTFSTHNEVGGVALQSLPYTNSENNYEVKSFFSKFITNYNLGMMLGIKYVFAEDENLTADFLKNALTLPLIKTENIPDEDVKFVVNKNLYKDNKEIPMQTFQFEFCSDTRNIYFTKHFIRLQQAVRNIEMPSYSLYISNGNLYNYGSENLPDSASQVQGNISIVTLGNTTAEITFSIGHIPENTVLYVVGQNNEVWLAILFKTAQENPVIHFNVLDDRDIHTYDNDGITIIDEI